MMLYICTVSRMDDATEFFQEWAATMQFDGGRNQPDAEYAAMVLMRQYCERNGLAWPSIPYFHHFCRYELRWCDDSGVVIEQEAVRAQHATVRRLGVANTGRFMRPRISHSGRCPLPASSNAASKNASTARYCRAASPLV